MTTGPSHHGRQRLQLRPVVAAALLFALLLCVVAARVPSSSAAFTGMITNATNAAQTAPYFSCAAAATAADAYYIYPLDESPIGTTAHDLSGSARAGTYYGSPSHSSAAACQRDQGGSTTFDGNSSYVSTPTPVSNPQAFTTETWFRCTTAGGMLIGFSDA